MTDRYEEVSESVGKEITVIGWVLQRFPVSTLGSLVPRWPFGQRAISCVSHVRLLFWFLSQASCMCYQLFRAGLLSLMSQFWPFSLCFNIWLILTSWLYCWWESRPTLVVCECVCLCLSVAIVVRMLFCIDIKSVTLAIWTGTAVFNSCIASLWSYIQLVHKTRV